jgi:hypothetical protein
MEHSQRAVPKRPLLVVHIARVSYHWTNTGWGVFVGPAVCRPRIFKKVLALFLGVVYILI